MRISSWISWELLIAIYCRTDVRGISWLWRLAMALCSCLYGSLMGGSIRGNYN